MKRRRRPCEHRIALQNVTRLEMIVHGPREPLPTACTRLPRACWPGRTDTKSSTAWILLSRLCCAVCWRTASRVEPGVNCLRTLVVQPQLGRCASKHTVFHAQWQFGLHFTQPVAMDDDVLARSTVDGLSNNKKLSSFLFSLRLASRGVR